VHEEGRKKFKKNATGTRKDGGENGERKQG